jgi:hypothetical protein
MPYQPSNTVGVKRSFPIKDYTRSGSKGTEASNNDTDTSNLPATVILHIAKRIFVPIKPHTLFPVVNMPTCVDDFLSHPSKALLNCSNSQEFYIEDHLDFIFGKILVSLLKTLNPRTKLVFNPLSKNEYQKAACGPNANCIFPCNPNKKSQNTSKCVYGTIGDYLIRYPNCVPNACFELKTFLESDA